MSDFDASDLKPPAAWQHLPFFAQDLPGIRRVLSNENRAVFPPASHVFAALAACAPEAVQVVILGQDPYPTAGHAHGLSFSVEPDIRPLPRSLNNIFKEMDEDLGGIPPNGDLRFWAHQGVLLLNSALTVPEGTAGGHARIGWSRLTLQVLNALNNRPRAFVLWGKHAQGFQDHLTHPDHLILATAHPSPLSARRGFFGSRPFSRINEWLKAKGQSPINWTTP